jgi:hypothetical protein
MTEDKKRFEKLIEILPEEFVDDFVNYWLYNNYYPREYSKTFDEYSEYTRKTLSKFSDKKINLLYDKLNSSFEELKKFLIEHFYIPKAHYESGAAKFLYLEPRLNYNFWISEGGPKGIYPKEYLKEFNSLKGRVNLYAESFERDYKSLIETLKKKYDVEDMRNSRKESLSSKILLVIVPVVITAATTFYITYFSNKNIEDPIEAGGFTEEKTEDLNQKENDYKSEQDFRIENRILLEDCLKKSKDVSDYQYESLCPGILSGKNNTCKKGIDIGQAFDVIESAKSDRESICFKKYPQY